MVLGVAIIFLHAFREVALEEAGKRPLFALPSKRLTPGELYPNVYDTLSMIKQSASFIAGNKVMRYYCIVNNLLITY